MQVINQVNPQIKSQGTSFGSIHFKFPAGKSVKKSSDELDKFISNSNDFAESKNHKSLMKDKPLLEIESIDGFGVKVKANVVKGFKGITELKTALLAEKSGLKVGGVDNFAYQYQKENGNAQKILNNTNLAI